MKLFIQVQFVLIFWPLFVGATWIDPDQIRIDLKPIRISDAKITEGEFQNILREIESLYAPLAQYHGGQLRISGDWKSEKLNAGARQLFGTWQVQITGGVARRPELTKDGLSLILCHELGHHFGGFVIGPASNPLEKPWAANEGQADYYSTQVCARKLWLSRAQENAEFRHSASPTIRDACDQVWSQEPDQDLCYRVMTAVESLTATMAAILGKNKPELSQPDTTIVAKTNHGHPEPQCRMDTAAHGALCKANFNDAIIPGKNLSSGIESIEAEQQAANFSCTKSSGYTLGLRPFCWFKPRL